MRAVQLMLQAGPSQRHNLICRQQTCATPHLHHSHLSGFNSRNPERGPTLLEAAAGHHTSAGFSKDSGAELHCDLGVVALAVLVTHASKHAAVFGHARRTGNLARRLGGAHCSAAPLHRTVCIKGRSRLPLLHCWLSKYSGQFARKGP